MRKLFIFSLVVFVMLGLLAGCGAGYPQTEDVSFDPNESAADKTIITLGVIGENSEAAHFAALFNDENSDYFVELVELTRYNYLDEISGDNGLASDLTPDMLWCGGWFDHSQYNSKCSELTAFVDNDDVIRREDFVHGILGSGYEGSIYSIPLDFSICAYFTPAPYSADKDYLFDLASCDREVLFERLNSYTVSNILSNPNTSFDEMGFSNIMSLGIASSKETSDADQSSFIYYLPIQKSFGTIQSARLFTDGNYTLCGIPSNNSNGCMYQVNNEICLTNYCRDKDGALEFIRFLLTPERQMEMCGLPVIADCFNKQVEEALASGVLIPEDADKLNSLISETNIVQHSLGIYKTEIKQMFFECYNGWKTPEEATDKLDEYFC